MNDSLIFVVIISADAEWRAIRGRLPEQDLDTTPYGECVPVQTSVNGRPCAVVYFHGGWGKIAAAGSTQYAIDRWRPDLLINIGTCGGFAADIKPGTLLLVDFTLVYDIQEQMGDPAEALAYYATEIDLAWLPRQLPQSALRRMLLSADRDIVAEEIQGLRERYGAVAADWESGAIAFVAARNKVRCLILRMVSDVVSADGDETYGNLALFETRTEEIMYQLMDQLPSWFTAFVDPKAYFFSL